MWMTNIVTRQANQDEEWRNVSVSSVVSNDKIKEIKILLRGASYLRWLMIQANGML